MAEWTVLLYMAANNDLDGAAQSLVQDLGALSYGEGVNVLAQASSEQNGTRRVVLGGGVTTVTTWPFLDMSLGSTLTDFLDWGGSKYPARHTALIMWGHGGGWEDPDVDPLARRRPLPALRNARPRRPERDLIAWDGGNYMTNQTFRQAIEGSSLGKVDVLGCDACQMGAVELAYELRHAADYYVASELDEDGSWAYAKVLGDLAKNPAESPFTLAQSFVATFAPAPTYTLAAVQSQQMDALSDAMAKLATDLVTWFHPKKDSYVQANFQKIQAAALAATVPNLPTVLDLDLVRLLDELEKAQVPVETAIIGVRKALDAARYAKHISENVKSLGGLSIFFPVTQGLTKWGTAYGTLEFGGTNRWTGFLQAFFDAQQTELMNELRALRARIT